MELQLENNHGSGAQFDPTAPAMAAAAPAMDPAGLVIGDAARSASPLGALLSDNVELSEDSLGLTPPKPTARRHRSASATTRSAKMTMRSVSSGRKRGMGRPPSPALEKRLKNVDAPVKAVDGTNDARIAALEKQQQADHVFKVEVVNAIRNLQNVTEHLKHKTDQVTQERESHTQLGLQLRREMYVIRDQLTEKINVVAQQTEATLNQQAAVVIENKFRQLDGLIQQLQAHVVSLNEREGAVEKAVQQQNETKPHEEQVLSGAFQHIDQKISQVGEMVRKFEKSGMTTVTNGANAVPFTRAMQTDMEHIHNKLLGIDAETLKVVTDNVTPICEQLNIMHNQASAQQEQLAIITEALSSRNSGSLAPPCVPCGAANPWSAAGSGPRTCPSGPPGFNGNGGPGSSGDGDPMDILRAVVGGNNQCHCIHVKELIEKVTALEQRRGGEAPGAQGQGRGLDPWQSGPCRGSASPLTARHEPAPHRRPLPLHLPGPLGTIAHENRPIFDNKMTIQDDFKFNGVKDGLKWKGKVERYFISCAPVLLDILTWAEREDNEVISVERFTEAVGLKLTGDQVLNINAALWGFLSGVVSGSAETMFKRADQLNGLDAWRRLVRHIDQGRDLHRNALRREMKQMHLKPMKSLQDVEQGVAEFENVIAEYTLAGGTPPTEKEMKDDLLAILPEKLQTDLLWHATDHTMSFPTFRDMVVVQSAKVLAILKPSRPLHGVNDEVPTLYCRPPPAEQMIDDENAMDMFNNISNVEDLVAAFQKFNRNKKARGAPPTRKDEPPRKPRRCPNCGEEHASKVCHKPAVAIADRKCWGCGRPGHNSRDCPDKKRGLKAIEDGLSSSAGALNGFFMVDAEGYEPVRSKRSRGTRARGNACAENEPGPSASIESPAARRPRPMPKQATIADFISKNSWDALNDRSSDTRSAAALDSSLMSCSAKPHKPSRRTIAPNPKGTYAGKVSFEGVGGRKMGAPYSAKKSSNSEVVNGDDPDKMIEQALKEAENSLCSFNYLDHAHYEDDELIANTSEQVKIRVAMDSAAVDNVISPEELPADVEYEPNSTGRHFVGANNAHIEKYGSCDTKLSSGQGDVGCHWQLADVTRPLHSVARVTGPKEGPGKQDVLFDNERCVVVPPGTVKQLMKRLKPVAEYSREGNLYIADMTLSSFRGQGQSK